MLIPVGALLTLRLRGAQPAPIHETSDVRVESMLYFPMERQENG
jgi:hypothetical protein